VRPVTTITGIAMPLPRSDVDTDQIIPAEYLKRVERTGFGRFLFDSWRADPDFVLNRPEHAGAVVLVAGPNFGTGSSREHAVWALLDYGFGAVVCERFGDIFRVNCTKNGLVPAQVDGGVAGRLLAALAEDPDLEVTVDVDRRVVEAAAIGLHEPFVLDDATRERFLQGLDDIGLTLRHRDEIDAYEAGRPDWLPTATPGEGSVAELAIGGNLGRRDESVGANRSTLRP
jgi:3-isopropylmalate/(R)-2-methylmalate dehydratase small subunit